MTSTSTKVIVENTNEIDLIQLLKAIWKSRRFVVKTTVLVTLIAIFFAIFSQKEYTTSSTFVQLNASSNSGSSGLSGLASLAGISMSSSQAESLPASLYPKIVSSIKFKKQLLAISLSPVGSEDSVSYAEFYSHIHKKSLVSKFKYYTIGLPGLILESFQSRPSFDGKTKMVAGSLMILSEEEIGHFERLDEQISLVVNDKEGSIQLSFTMPEPMLAAQMVTAAREILQKEIIGFKVDKAQKQLEFIEERYKEKKKEFEDIQNRIASYRDSNQGIVTATARNELDGLQAEYNLAFNVFNDLAQQLEKARFDVKKDTPVLSVIQEAIVPYRKSAPRRMLYLIFGAFLGVFLSAGYILAKIAFDKVREEIIQ